MKANEYPAVLIEAGVLTTRKDLNYLIKHENQETIARNILNGVERYAAQITFSNDPEKVKKNDDKIFTVVETEARFPGGQQTWIKYIQDVLQKNADGLIKEHNEGTCLVQFIVDTNGNVSDVKATNMEKTSLAEIATGAIKKGPEWKPALQNGRSVASYKKQLITFKIADNIADNEPK